MKPLNYDNSPCSPISSNCVIWQGPDLHCIKLCKGDTVSDVIASLATELCTVMEQLNITNYDLSCFDLVGCKPATFEALLQFLIEQICSLQESSTTGSETDDKEEDPLVTVAPCFIVNGITVMSLTEYVIAIGNKLCDLVNQIASINNTLIDYNIRITDLENAVPPTFTLPTLAVDCTLQDSPFIGFGSPALPINQILNVLINDNTYGYCALRSATGLPTALVNAVLSQCILNTDLQLSTGTAWSTNPNWDLTPTTVADAINNIWLVICDTYNYLEDVITVQDTNTVNLTLSSTNILSADIQDSGWHPLNGFDWYGPNIISQRPRARRIGNVIYFKGVVMVPLANPITDLPILWDYNSPSIDTYAPLTSIKPAETGAGSVVISAGGSITFNEGNSVIPASVLPLGITLDDNYSFNWEMGYRTIQMISPTALLTTSILTTLFKTVITSDKKLVFQLVRDIEESATSITNNVYGTSLANNLISNVQEGEYVPFYRDATSVMNSSPTSGLNSVSLQYGVSPITGDTYTFPFTCQASDVKQVGGFGWIKLDPYSTYISPCDVSIPTPNPCAIP